MTDIQLAERPVRQEPSFNSKANELVKQGRFNAVEQIALEALQQKDPSGFAWNLLALVALHQNQPKKARHFLELAILDNPDHWIFHKNMLQLAIKLDDKARGMSALQQLARLDKIGKDCLPFALQAHQKSKDKKRELLYAITKAAVLHNAPGVFYQCAAVLADLVGLTNPSHLILVGDGLRVNGYQYFARYTYQLALLFPLPEKIRAELQAWLRLPIEPLEQILSQVLADNRCVQMLKLLWAISAYKDYLALFRYVKAHQPDWLSNQNRELEKKYFQAILVSESDSSEVARQYFQAQMGKNEWHDAVLYSLCLLRQGQYQAAWPVWEMRCRKYQSVLPINSVQWDGKPNLSKTLLLLNEQGLGDVLMMLRFIPWLQSCCKNIIYICPKALVAFVRLQFPELNVLPLEQYNPKLPPKHDGYALIFSLPAFYQLHPHNIPGQARYFSPEPLPKVTLPSSSKLKVGICWLAKLTSDSGLRRTLAPEDLQPLLALPNVQYYNLQYQYPAETLNRLGPANPVIELGEQIAPIEQLASFLLELDVLVTADTYLAHLAGGLGVKTLVMMPSVPDWRWFDQGKFTGKTPWYDSLLLFKQEQFNEWSKPIAAVVRYLQRL